MKTKTESKRQAIIKAAAEVFREFGFDRASMSDIRERLGGSKATLYNYFPSKEKLFFEVMHQAKEAELETIAGELDADTDDIRRELTHFGLKFLTVLYSADAIAVRRLTIAESRHSDIGRLSFEQAVVPIEKQVAEFLRKAMKRGLLRAADSKVAAMHMLSLLESELLQRLLLGVIDSVKPETISAAVRRAVDVFLYGYERR
ncbi:MAG TPA: TetR/AcrR family transcriptional regulator [Steroidobacteraceae bacterium]|nr:TetR/AcrR family transcriptional regulator [Steroidobacteraceae bacterium]